MMWIVIIVHVHWPKLELAGIEYEGEDKVIWALCQINDNAYKTHLTFSLWSSPIDPQRTRKEIKLFTRESSQQAKEERKIFWVFFLITTTSMESKLIKSYN